MNKKFSFEQWMVTAIIVLGVGFSLYQYLINKFLWLDEACLSLNIMHRDYEELARPLDYSQVAPILFLYIQKTLTFLFNVSEYTFRLFPLICFFGSIFFFYKILKILFPNPYALISGLSLFALNISLIYFSSEVKQYMTDVFVLTALYYLTIRNYTQIVTKYLLLGAVGLFAIYLSNVAPIILFSVGFYLLYNHIANKAKEFRNLVVVSFIWLIGFGIFYFSFVANHPTRDFMTGFWNGAFMPLNPFSSEFWNFFGTAYKMVFIKLISLGFVGLFLFPLLCILGIYHLIVSHKGLVLSLCLLPFVTHLFISAFELYPFDKRLVLYTIPLLILMVTYGIDFLISKLNFRILYLRLAVLLLIIALAANLATTLPIKSNNIKPCFSFLEKNINNGDYVYFSLFAKYPYQYYLERGEMNQISNQSNLVDHTYMMDELSQKIKSFNGKVWFIYSNYQENEKGNMEYLEEYCKTNKIEMLKKFEAEGASVMLYDFSEQLSISNEAHTIE
jgi:hypothetical protein